MSNQQTVICYYEALGSEFSEDSQKLIDMWRSSWSKLGWKPIVLDSSYAANHPCFEKLDLSNPDNSLYRDQKNKPYHMSCFYRLLAYCNYVLDNGSTLYADYDVINYGFSIADYMQYKHNTVITSGNSAVKLNEVGAADIVNAIQKRVDHYDSEIYNDMRCVCAYAEKLNFLNIHTKGNGSYIYNSINDHYEECKTSKLVHYHGGYSDLTTEQRFNTETRSEFIQKFRHV